MIAERAIPRLNADRETVPFHDSAIAWLICLWIVLQCFQYQHLPMFQMRIWLTVSPDRVVLGLILLMYLLRPFIAEGCDRVRLSALEKLLLCFACVGTLSWLTAGSETSTDSFRWLSTLANQAYLPLLAHFVATRLHRGRWFIRRIMVTFALIGVYLAFTGLCEHFKLESFVIPGYIMNPELGIQFGRVRGPFLSSTVDGGILLISFLALTFLFSCQTGVKRWLTLAMSFLVAAAIYYTETRSIWVALGVILLTLFVAGGRMRRPAAVMLGMIAIAFVAGVGSMFSIYQDTLFSQRQETIVYRFTNYMTALNMFSQNPIFGIGYGNFNKLWVQYFVDTSDVIGNLQDGNHSTLLGLFAELGLVGFTLYAGALLCALTTCVSAFRRLNRTSAFERDFTVVAFAALEAFCLIGITSDLRFHQLLNVVMFLLIGLASALRRNASRDGFVATQTA